MAEHLYGEEWDSDEFQTALKVVLKCEIQSLLERLSETGEETVLLTASESDMCVGHLASSKALRFVNTADVGIVKNKFLNFLTGVPPQQQQGARQITTGHVASTVTGKVTQVSPVINSMTSKGPLQAATTDSTAKKLNTKVVTPNQTKPAEKRSLETVASSQDFSSQSVDAKRRKTESQLPIGKGNVTTSLQTSSSSSVTLASASNVGKGPAPKLKTTKVVSKSGGFTEERISNAEFQKFLAQYKPNIPDGGEEDDISNQMKVANLAMLRSGSMPQIMSQKQFQPSPVSSVQSTQNKVTSQVTDKNIKSVNQSGKNQTTQSTELKKDNVSVKLENKSVNKENKESVNTSDIEIKEEVDPDDKQYKEAQTSIKKENEQNINKEKEKSAATPGNIQKKDTAGQSNKTETSSQSRNRLESIDNLDTATLIQMTKAKHQENMSEADREIQAKLGQLSSKLSWVVEYPKEKGQSGPSGKTAAVVHPKVSGSSGIAVTRQMHGPYKDNQMEDLEEMDDEDFDDDDDDEDDFDEDDLDEEDKAALKAMREAHMRKLGSAGMEGFEEEGEMYAEGFGISQNFHPAMGEEFHEGYDETEDYEEFEGYNSEEEMNVNMANLGNNRIHGTLPNLSGPGMTQGQGDGASVSGHPLYQRTASPTSENYLMIGPIMAKCLICNKIVRKTEMKSHHEAHLKEEPYDEEEEGEEEEELDELEENVGDADGGTFEDEQKTLPEDNDPAEGEYRQEEGEYTEEGGEYPEDEGEYNEEYEFQAEDTGDGMEFIAEKFVAEKLVAEKVGDISDASKDSTSDNVCDICNKTFKSHGNMMRHRKNIHNLKEETKEMKAKDTSMACQCPVCGKSFRYLQKHIRKMHPEFGGEHSQPGDISENSGDSVGLSCNICGELFAEEELLKEHFKVHT